MSKIAVDHYPDLNFGSNLHFEFHNQNNGYDSQNVLFYWLV